MIILIILFVCLIKLLLCQMILAYANIKVTIPNLLNQVNQNISLLKEITPL